MDQFVHPQNVTYTYNISSGNTNEFDSVADPGYGKISSSTKVSEFQGPNRSKSNGCISSGNCPGYDTSGSSTRSVPSSNLGSPSRNISLQDKNTGKFPDSKQRAPGAIESIANEGCGPSKYQQPPTADYKMYERGNIIAASKYATPKQVETITGSLSNMGITDKPYSDHQFRQAQPQIYPGSGTVQNGNFHGVIDHNKYYSASFMTKPGAASPTHSHSGSSRESNSPRASIAGMSGYDYSKNLPLYENIDCYNQRVTPQAPAYYHQLPQQHSTTHSTHSSQDSKHSSPRASYIGVDSNPNYKYETNYKKAQPQVPVSNKYNSTSYSGTKDMPPYEAPPVYENIQELSKLQSYESSKPGPQVPVHMDPRQHMVSHSSATTIQPPPYPSHNVSSSQPAPHYPVPVAMQKAHIPVTGTQLASVYERAHSTLPNPVVAKSVPTSASSVTTGQTLVASSNQYSVMSGIAGCASPVPIHQDLESPPSPTPSAKMKAVGPGCAKNLLPYNVTPPRSQVTLHFKRFTLVSGPTVFQAKVWISIAHGVLMIIS